MGKAEDDAKREEDAAAAEAALEERIGRIVDTRMNRAITTHFKRETPKLAETIGAQVLAGLKAAQGGGDDDDDEVADPAEPGKAGKKPPKGQSDEVTQRMKALEGQLAVEKKKREASEAKQVEAETRRARAEEDDAVKSALMAAGVKDEARIRAALHTHRGEGRIKRDEAGAIMFVKRSDDGDEEMPLTKGVAEWAKTDEGKVFLPPTGASGSGGTQPRNGTVAPAKGKYTGQQYENDLMAAIATGKMPGQS